MPPIPGPETRATTAPTSSGRSESQQSAAPPATGGRKATSSPSRRQAPSARGLLVHGRGQPGPEALEDGVVAREQPAQIGDPSARCELHRELLLAHRLPHRAEELHGHAHPRGGYSRRASISTHGVDRRFGSRLECPLAATEPGRSRWRPASARRHASEPRPGRRQARARRHAGRSPARRRPREEEEGRAQARRRRARPTRRKATPRKKPARKAAAQAGPGPRGSPGAGDRQGSRRAGSAPRAAAAPATPAAAGIAAGIPVEVGRVTHYYGHVNAAIVTLERRRAARGRHGPLPRTHDGLLPARRPHGGRPRSPSRRPARAR